MTHIAERFIIHFFASAGVLLCALFALRYAARKIKSKFIPKDFPIQLLVAGLAVFAVSTMREAYDVSNGQQLVKAFTDYASWLLGCGLSAYGLYRIRQ